MWHSIQSVNQLMEQRSCNSSGVNYTSVAMLLSDVVYITPLDLRDRGEPPDMMLKDNVTRFSSNAVTIPAFGQWPVSDRLVYGSPAAVKVWATQRLSRLWTHVSHGQRHHPGTGMHSEKFLAHTIFPLLICELNVTIRTHPTLCFVRAQGSMKRFGLMTR
jgi:hypothetical protein